MAITKIHPIKSTLNLAIDYITKSEKTDEKVLVSSLKWYPSTDHNQFIKTGEDNDSNSSVLYGILIQFFIIGKFGAIKKGYEFNAHSLFSYILLKVLSDFSFIVLKPLFIATKTPAIINTNTIIRGI